MCKSSRYKNFNESDGRLNKCKNSERKTIQNFKNKWPGTGKEILKK